MLTHLDTDQEESMISEIINLIVDGFENVEEHNEARELYVTRLFATTQARKRPLGKRTLAYSFSTKI